MASVRLRTEGFEQALTEDELAILLWAWNLGTHRPHGTGGNAIARLVVSGGTFEQRACGQLLAFGVIANKHLGPLELKVRKPKYGRNVCLGSEPGYELVLRHRVAYTNENAADRGVFVGKSRAKDAPGPATLADVPGFKSAVQAVERAARTGRIEAEHSAPAAYF